MSRACRSANASAILRPMNPVAPHTSTFTPSPRWVTGSGSLRRRRHRRGIGGAAAQGADLAFDYVARDIADHPGHLNDVGRHEIHRTKGMRQPVEPSFELDNVVVVDR